MPVKVYNATRYYTEDLQSFASALRSEFEKVVAKYGGYYKHSYSKQPEGKENFDPYTGVEVWIDSYGGRRRLCHIEQGRWWLENPLPTLVRIKAFHKLPENPLIRLAHADNQKLNKADRRELGLYLLDAMAPSARTRLTSRYAPDLTEQAKRALHRVADRQEVRWGQTASRQDKKHIQVSRDREALRLAREKLDRVTEKARQYREEAEKVSAKIARLEKKLT